MSASQTTAQGSPSTGGFSFTVNPQGQRGSGLAPHEPPPSSENQTDQPMDHDAGTSGAPAGNEAYDGEFPPLPGAAPVGAAPPPGWTLVAPKPKGASGKTKFRKFPPPVVGLGNLFNTSVDASNVALENPPPPGPATGEKRTREQVSTTPFVQGRTTKLRAIAEHGDRPTRSSEEEMREQEEKAALEKEKAAFRAEFAADTQAPQGGQLRVVRPSTADEAHRYCPSSKAMQITILKPEQWDIFLEARRKQLSWVWVGVYGHPNPDDNDVEHFLKALRHIESSAIIDDLDTDDYRPVLMKKEKGTVFLFPVFCTTMMARDRLLTAPTFAYAEGTRDRVFFIQGEKSWGQRVVLDFENAPIDEQEFLKGIRHTFKDIVACKVGKESSPVSFRYTKLEWSPPRAPHASPQKSVPLPTAVAANVKSLRWRVSFVPKRDMMEAGWVAPNIAGWYASRGEIQVKESPFCTMCVSYSHTNTHCNWWKVAGVMTTPKQPPGYKPLVWKKVSTFATSAQTPSTSTSKKGKGKESEFFSVEDVDEEDIDDVFD